MKRIAFFCLLGLYFSSPLWAQETKGKSGKLFVDFSEKEPPQIVWIYPEQNGLVTGIEVIELKIGVNSVEELSVQVYHNDNPISSRGLKVVEEGHNYDQMVKQKVLLNEGENEIKIEVSTPSGHLVKEIRTISWSGEYADIINRKDYALLFATDEYDEWNDLVNPINDARTIAKELESEYNFKVELIENATKDEIWSKLTEYSQKSYLKNDQLFIFFAGHGLFVDQLREGFLVAKDSKKNDISKSSYISYNRIRPMIDGIGSEHIFLVMDACFGGTFDPTISNSGYRGEEDNLYKEISNLEYLKRKLRYKTRKFLTSGGKEYVPDGRPGMHSPFARKLIESFRSRGGSDGVLTIQEIIGYVEKLRPEPRAGEFGDNVPGSEFVFVIKN